MDKKTVLIVLAAVLAGVVFADKIRSLPVVGSKIPTM
jgi:hypothetical protein